MKRDWLTLTFGLILVGIVVALSLRQNLTREPTPRSTPEPSVPVALPPAAREPAAVAPPVTGAGGTRRSARSKKRPAAAAARLPDATPTPDVVLRVQSDVPGASVFLDREFVGVTPLTLRGLTVGSKRINVTAEGHDSYADTLDLAEGMNRVRVEFRKVVLDKSIPVVHRHAMGSCQGTLAATVNGITFETTNKGDTFTITFADIDQFEMDYLKKNLRLRRRGGRTWNFTNDSADALFVFHRDVTKAREKLAGTRY